MTERSRETWASLRRWLVFSVLQPYSAHLYDILSTDDVNFISHSIMIAKKKRNLSFMFVTRLPPRYSPQINTNEKSCSFAFGTFRSISQRKIGIKFHNTVLHVPFSLSLLFCLSFPITFFFNNVEKKNPTDNKLQTRLIDEVARFHSNAGDEWKRHPPRPCTWLL